MGSVGIDPDAVGLVLLSGLVNVGFLGIFRLELFLDRGLEGTLEMCLAGEEGGTLSLEISVNLFGKVGVEGSLLVRLESNGIERVSKFAGEETSVNGSPDPRWCGWMTYPTSSLPRFCLASFASCFAYSSSMFALEGSKSEPRAIVVQPTGGCGVGVPLLPKPSQFVNRSRSTTHPSEHDVDASISSSPECVTEVE